MARSSGRTAAVPVDGGLAELVPDPDRARAWTLLVDGTPQSHVDLDDPRHLEFEYVRRLAHVADSLAAPGEPLNVLHLGGGGCTLARYVAATRPGSRQRVVEIDGPLVELVRQRLPLPAGSGVRVRVGEARQVVESLAPGSVDLLVLDVFAGARTPAHLTSMQFVSAAARLLRPAGLLAANVADGPPLAFARRQVATVQAVLGEAVLLAPAAVLRGRRFGNLIVVAGRPSAGGSRIPVPELSRLAAADPFPARLLDGAELLRFVAGAAPVDDADAVPSPPPPPDLFGLR